MTIENRLAQMKKYLEEALIDPIANALYIEDLQLSIKTFEQMKPRQIEVFNGGLAIDS